MDHSVLRLILLTEILEVAAQNETLSYRDLSLIRDCADALFAAATPVVEVDRSQCLIPF